MTEWVMALSALANVALVVALVLVTRRYANETKDIADATREQAKASVKMAEEMREQRMALDRPNLLIYFRGTTPPKRPYVAGQSTEEELARFPDRLSFTVYNDGPGPARILWVVYADFLPQHRDYLLSKEKWNCTLEGRGVAVTIEAMLGIEHISHPAADRAIVVTYSDVHDRRWQALLELHEIRGATGSTEEPNEMCLVIESGDQRTFGPYVPEVQQ